MDDNECSTWQTQLDQIEWQDYKDAVKQIVEIARSIANAEVGALFLTADGILLEAAEWQSEDPNPPPASLLPTYRLHWFEQDDKKLGGITAYVAVRRKPQNLNQQQVPDHDAWKGKWDAVFLKGGTIKCSGILALPLQSEIGAAPNEARVHGVLKVENPQDATTLGRFRPEQEQALQEFAKRVASKLDGLPDFWCEFVRTRADLKISYLVELLERGRSLRYNLCIGLGYALHLFAGWLGCERGVQVFWHAGAIPNAHLLRLFDFARGERPQGQEELKEKGIVGELVTWLGAQVGEEIVQPGLPISRNLWDVLFPRLQYGGRIDLIRLKASGYDLGAVVLPRSRVWQSEDRTSPRDAEILDTLTRHAINTVSVLGRFIGDEYDATSPTYLPRHRPPKVSRTCGILFADIRRFSQLTQILRMMGKPELMEPFLDQYCAQMGKIIGDVPLGRVDKFLGDGIMALFGEYLDSPEENHSKIVVAVHCACEMLKQFGKLYETWVTEGLAPTDVSYGLWQTGIDPEEATKSEPLHDLRKEFNEDVEIHLAIGINVGQVFFDYFGDRSHREYTAIGDHVNFTQRLGDAAHRYDEQEGRMRTNILVSQAAYRCLDDNSYLLTRRDPLWVRLQGFGFTYPVHELECSDLDHAKIAQALRELEGGTHQDTPL